MINKHLHLIDITKPIHGALVYLDSYWQVIDNAKQAIFYKDVPQCNRHKKIAEMVGCARRDDISDHFNGEFKVIHVPIAYFIDEGVYEVCNRGH